MTKDFGYRAGNACIAYAPEGYYVWDSAVIRAEGKYHLFCSRWREELGFGANWLFNSEIIHAVAQSPEGPFVYQNTVLPRRGRTYFDGMNTHNTCVRCFGGKYYLYYMGTTYEGDAPASDGLIAGRILEVWNKKRIGLAVADDVNGNFVRRNEPLLLPRDSSHWDCTAITNPAVAILPDGKTYMIYKSRRGDGAPLQLGVAVAEHPNGTYTRLTDTPILQFENENVHVEDPCLWYDVARKKFCLIAKDDCKNGYHGITDEWGAGFYAESDDCIHFEIAKNPKVYSRTLTWQDGHVSQQCNLERPFVLFNEKGEPDYLYCATGNGSAPYSFEGKTYIVAIKLNKIREEKIC